MYLSDYPCAAQLIHYIKQPARFINKLKHNQLSFLKCYNTITIIS
jgi:hypothetical protein